LSIVKNWANRRKKKEEEKGLNMALPISRFQDKFLLFPAQQLGQAHFYLHLFFLWAVSMFSGLGPAHDYRLIHQHHWNRTEFC
jgi:hypothetical protein